MSKTKPTEITSLIFSIMRTLRNCHSQGPQTDPLSFLHFKTLAIVDDLSQPTMKEIAGILLITSPSATDIINRLVKAGELKRLTDSHDRRKILLATTPKGKKILAAGQKEMDKRIRLMLNKLNNREYLQFVRLLKKINSK